MNVSEFRNWETKRITLLSMSGIGKTRLASLLSRNNWYHYSGDYRIGSRYLDEEIVDNIRRQMMKTEFLADMLRSDSIYIKNNISFRNLHSVASYLGKIGDPNKGGLLFDEFIERQQLHRKAEISAMLDVPIFIKKAQQIYGYPHFINDAGGSICELDEPLVIETLVENTILLYIKATKEDEERIIKRVVSSPKPLYYRQEFLEESLKTYFLEKSIDSINSVHPDDFAGWVFPHLFHSRIPRYEKLAKEFGYSVISSEVNNIRTEEDFIELIARSIDRETH